MKERQGLRQSSHTAAPSSRNRGQTANQRSPFAPRPFPDDVIQASRASSGQQQSPPAPSGLANYGPMMETQDPALDEYQPPVVNPLLRRAQQAQADSNATDNHATGDRQSPSEAANPPEVAPDPSNDVDQNIAQWEAKIAAEEQLLEDKIAAMDEELATVTDPEILRRGHLEIREIRIRILEREYDRYIAALMEAGYEEQAFNASERIRTLTYVTLYETDNQADLPETLNLQDIQNQILDEDTAILQYAILPGKSYVWVITPNGLTSHELPGSETLTDTKEPVGQYIRRLFMPITTPQQSAYQQAANDASEAMQLPEIVTHLSGFSRLVIVPDGDLQRIPLEGLPTDPSAPVPQGQLPNLLADDYEIVYIPSATSLAIAREQLASQPVVNDADEAFAAIYGVSDFGTWSDLPGVAQEVVDVADAIPGEETVLENEEATLEAVQGLANGSYEVIHFSSHGDASKLILSDGQQDIEVSTAQLSAMNISTELFVLAMCQSGRGTDDNGNLAIGRALLSRVGIPRVVTSAWNVDDAGTALFMKFFYEALYVDQLSAAGALSQAQEQMRNSQNFASPKFWAAFRLQGDWEESTGATQQEEASP